MYETNPDKRIGESSSKTCRVRIENVHGNADLLSDTKSQERSWRTKECTFKVCCQIKYDLNTHVSIKTKDLEQESQKLIPKTAFERSGRRPTWDWTNFDWHQHFFNKSTPWLPNWTGKGSYDAVGAISTANGLIWNAFLIETSHRLDLKQPQTK